ncbi:MAG: hypothetical protein J6S40_08415 [Thermoguttaceae bacterium]|nr:hypothetical protein [Thermoguttaceae bacterium]
MYSKFWLTFVGLAIGLGAYVVYAAIVVPTFIMPRAVRQRVSMPRATIDASSEVERISRENSELLAEVFPNPTDWRRLNPLSVIAKDRSWLLLFPKEPEPGKETLAFNACTFVWPSGDKDLSERERFRRAVVIETNDKVELRFKDKLSFQSLSAGFSPSNVEGGQFQGQVTIRSVMDPENTADNFSLTTRNITFNLETINTDSEVIIHYGRRQVEGVGLRMAIDLSLPEEKKEGENAAPEEGPLDDELNDGNVGHGFSIRQVTLNKLTRLEFEMDDFLPTLPDVNPWDGSASVDPGSEEAPQGDGKTPKKVTMDVRCRDGVIFEPDPNEGPTTWCARFSGNVEITAFHEERQTDSIRCDYLTFYLSDSELQQKLDKFESLYKGKRKPNGKISRLRPSRISATGSPERKSSLQVEGGFVSAEAGVISFEPTRQRLALFPLKDSTPGNTIPAAAQKEEEETVLQYGKLSFISKQIEYIHGKEGLERLIAVGKGRLETDLPTDSPDEEAEHLSVAWNEKVQVIPDAEEKEMYVASVRGGLSVVSTLFGSLTAREADFWFKSPMGKKEGSSDGKMPKITPVAAKLAGDVEMTAARGKCLIRDRVDLVFDRNPSGAAGSSLVGEKPKGNPFDVGGSMMGEEGNSTFDISAGEMKICLSPRPVKGYDVPLVTMMGEFRVTETDPLERKETLRIDGDSVQIENPGTSLVTVALHGAPANFVGSGLTLIGKDIQVSRPENRFSVSGRGRLRFAIPKGSGMPSADGGAVSDEPVEVWWPSSMSFDGRQLVFHGKPQPEDGSIAERPKDDDQVIVRQGSTVELKSPMIVLSLKQPIQIFDFDMGKDASGAKRLPLNTTTCLGSRTAPVSVAWNGVVPADPDTAGAGEKKPLRGRARGEATSAKIEVETGVLTVSGPGWLRGMVETPDIDAGDTAGTGGDSQKEALLAQAKKPWTHFHLVFRNGIVGNIRDRHVNAEGDVRLAVVGSEKPQLDLDVNGIDPLPPGTFDLSCGKLELSESAQSGETERSMGITARDDARFKYQTFIGRADTIKYDHRKRTVSMTGNGLSPATLSRQERIGAPISTQTFNSVSFNLDTEKIGVSLSETGVSSGDMSGLLPGR